MIILVRHATPNVDYSPCDYLKARDLTAEYDTTNSLYLHEIEQYFNTSSYYSLKEIEIDKIICSPLTRAQLTCQTLFSGRDYTINPNFREAETEIGKIPFIKLKLRHWFLINRIKWFMGFNSDKIESKEAFVDRVYRAYINTQSVSGNIAIVAHGVFLKFLKDEWLIDDGYVVIDKYKNGCFTVEILKKVIIF